MSLQAGEAEKILIGLIDEWLKEGNSNGKSINQSNLDKFNKANSMALKIFDKAKKIDFEKPRQDLDYAQTTILYGTLDIENDKNKPLYEEFISLIDDFSISPIDGTTVAIRFSINNIWEE